MKLGESCRRVGGSEGRSSASSRFAATTTGASANVCHASVRVHTQQGRMATSISLRSEGGEHAEHEERTEERVQMRYGDHRGS
jgi:hypothetical protein